LVLLYAAAQAYLGSGEQRERDRHIDELFARSAAFVDGFSRAHGRLPTRAEFSEWKKRGGPSLQHVQYRTNKPPRELTAALGAPAAPGYYLALWRERWYEYFAPWAGRSTIEPSDLRWYLLTYGAPATVNLLLSAGLLLLARWLWRYSPVAAERHKYQ
jgi:hypothetical protein